MATREPTGTLDRPPAVPAAAPRRRLELSATQVLASALAAITATVAGSFLGVSGTVIGAAVASVVTVVGNAVYGHSLRRTRDRVREVVPRFAPAPGRPFLADGRSAAAPAAPTEEMPVLRAHRAGPAQHGPWRAVVLGSIAVFAAVLAVVTGVEIVAGRPLADLVRGDSGTGTSVFGDAGRAASTAPSPTRATVPTVTRTVTPVMVITTPTVTRTAPAVTRTATPTVTTTPSSSAPSSAAAPPSTATTSP